MKRLTAIVCSLYACVALAAEAPPQSPPPGYTQVFACTLRDGKTMDDLWATMESFATPEVVSTGAGDPGFSIFMWAPFRTAAPYDFVWGVNSSSLVQLGRGLSEYLAGPTTPAIEARFNDTAECIAGIVMSRQTRMGSIGNTADREVDAIVETLACSLNDNAAPDALDKAVAFWNTQVDKINSPSLKKYGAWLWSPYRGGTGDWDFMWVGAYPDLASWAQGDTDYYGSKEGQAAEARFASTGACPRTSLWFGYWIVAPQA